MFPRFDSRSAEMYVEELRQEAREVARSGEVRMTLRRRVATILVWGVALLDPELLSRVSDQQL